MLQRLRNNWYDFKYGLKSIWLFFPVIWKWRSWDFEYTLRVLKRCLELQRKDIKKNARFVGYERAVKEMSIAIQGIDRYLTYNDFDFSNRKVPDGWCECKEKDRLSCTHNWRRAAKIEQEYLNIALNMLRRKITSWWD